jgi:DNA-binding CsgD family transcriptional regulator/PAS domain-containing protein
MATPLGGGFRIEYASMNDHLGVGAGALVDLVADFYSASMDGRFWPTALAKLREALAARVCALAAHDFGTGQGVLEQVVGLDAERVGAYAEYWGRHNPCLQGEEEFRLAGAVWTEADLAADEAAAGEFAQHWLMPQDLRHQMFGVLERTGNRVVFLYVLRPAAAGPFAEAEMALLRRLLPYLQRGLRAGQLLRRTQGVRQVALDALDAMPIGVLLVSGGGTVLAANRAARETMAARDVLLVGRHGLELSPNGRRLRFRDMLAEMPARGGGNRPGGPLALTLPRQGGLRPLTLLVWSVPTTAGAGLDEPAAMVFVGDPDRSADIDEERLRRLYGLTAAEARVAALLARGHRLEEIATQLGVAYETTRKHLKQIFTKTSTARQAALVRTLVAGPGGVTL